LNTARWEHFSHGADIGVRGIAPTLNEAFVQAALALTAVVTDPGDVRPEEAIEIDCAAPDSELLLVDWLLSLPSAMARRGLAQEALKLCDTFAEYADEAYFLSEIVV